MDKSESLDFLNVFSSVLQRCRWQCQSLPVVHHVIERDKEDKVIEDRT